MIGDDGSKNFVLSITYSTGLLACAAVTLLRIAWIVRAGRARAMGITMRPVSLAIWAASMLVAIPRVVFSEDYGQATVNPMLLAEQDLAAESRGDVPAALALYRDDAIVQYGGLCWTPCVGKATIEKELERRVAARNEWKIIGKYVSGNVAVVQAELKIGFIEYTGVDHVVVWSIYEVTGDKISAVTLAGQRTDPQTRRFIEYSRPTR